MQGLLYVLPDTKTQSGIKIGNVFPYHGCQRCKLLCKIMINTFWKIEYWAKYSTNNDPYEKPLPESRNN